MPRNRVDFSQQAYYPSPAKTRELHNDFKILFDHVYGLQRQVGEMKDQHATLQAEHSKLQDQHSQLKQQMAGGPSTTKIAGLYVAGVPPANGQKLTYNSATGQIEWQ